MLETDTGKFQDIFFMSIGNSVISARNTGDLSRSSFSFFFFREHRNCKISVSLIIDLAGEGEEME